MFSSFCSFVIVSVRLYVRSALRAFGIVSVRLYVRSALRAFGIVSVRLLEDGFLSFGKSAFGTLSAHGLFLLSHFIWLCRNIGISLV